METEHNQRLAEIENTLKDIHKILKPTRFKLFVEGLWRAVGYLIGLILAIIILSWLLNIIGLIPFMTEFSQNMKEVLSNARTK